MERPRRSISWPSTLTPLQARIEHLGRPRNLLNIALVNNMPDSALEDTEQQFFQLIQAAAGDTPVQIQLYFLPSVLRSQRGEDRLREFYSPIELLWSHGADCAIVTGTEPRQSDLRAEPYWSDLAQLLDWAEENTFSTVLSCLAAHAAVLHSDGIVRRPRAEKLFGVFEEKTVREHNLTQDVGGSLHFPHSRWNDVAEADLSSCGYEVLTRSHEAGAGLFAKKKKKSLFVHFQGHPEYGPNTLLKEYRRDIGRYLRRERSSYPPLPKNYFGEDAANILGGFREDAMSRSLEATPDFPEADVSGSLNNAWRASAVCLYRNWLAYLASRKAETVSSVPQPAQMTTDRFRRSASAG